MADFGDISRFWLLPDGTSRLSAEQIAVYRENQDPWVLLTDEAKMRSLEMMEAFANNLLEQIARKRESLA